MASIEQDYRIPKASNNVYSGTTAAEAPREQRVVEGHVSAARSLLDQANNINLAMDELRHRLLGLSEPNSPPRDKEPPQLVRHELAELGLTLERLHVAMQAMGSKINDLQRI